MNVSRLNQWIVITTSLRHHAFAMENALGRLPEEIAEREYNEFFVSTAKHAVTLTVHICEEVGLKGAADQARRLLNLLDKTPQLKVMAFALNDLYNRITSDTEDVQFVSASGSHAKLLDHNSDDVCSDMVASKLNKAAIEMEEGRICLAMGLTTASVFHMMRASELAVQRLGKLLKISLDPETTSWANIMDQVEKKIRELSAKSAAQRKKRNSLAAASAHLQAVRIAWRNEVMHPHRSYDEVEAWDIYRSTRAFMENIAPLLPEPRRSRKRLA